MLSFAKSSPGEHKCPRCDGKGCYHCDRKGIVRQCPRCGSDQGATPEEGEHIVCAECKGEYSADGQVVGSSGWPAPPPRHRG